MTEKRDPDHGFADRIRKVERWLFDPPTSDTVSRAEQIDAALAFRRYIRMVAKVIAWGATVVVAVAALLAAVREAMAWLL